jgi:hypothetical protein
MAWVYLRSITDSDRVQPRHFKCRQSDCGDVPSGLSLFCKDMEVSDSSEHFVSLALQYAKSLCQRDGYGYCGISDTEFRRICEKYDLPEMWELDQSKDQPDDHYLVFCFCNCHDEFGVGPKHQFSDQNLKDARNDLAAAARAQGVVLLKKNMNDLAIDERAP